MSMPDDNFAVLADEPVDGLADRVAVLSGVDHEEAAAQLEPGLDADGVPIGTERGLRDTLRRAVARLSTRRLVDDLGEAAAAFEILGLHVPLGGRASVDVRQSAELERQIRVKLFGFGFGSGRTMSIEMSEGIAERGSCMRVMQHVMVHVRQFDTGDAEPGGELVTTDVVRFGERQFVAWPDCPHCHVAAEPDPFEFDLSSDETEVLDLRGYDSEVRRERTVKLEGTRRAEIGLDVLLHAGSAATAGFNLEQRTSLNCAIAYTFVPGRRFVPYRQPGDSAALPYWYASLMGLLADTISRSAPSGAVDSAERPDTVRCWRYWLQAKRHKRDNAFHAANAALKESSEIAEALDWTHGTAPIWYVEAEALRGALLHDDGDHGAAAETLGLALTGWMFVGAVIGVPGTWDEDFARPFLTDAHTMVSALAGDAALTAYATELGLPLRYAAALIFAEDRFIPMIAEVASRTVDLTGQIRSYDEARRLVNKVLGASHGWQLPRWDPVSFEIGLRKQLASTANAVGRSQAALGQADDALALTQQLEAGRGRDVTEAELYSNRAGALLRLGRAADAARDFSLAEERLRMLGMRDEALRVRLGMLRARAAAGEPIPRAVVTSLLANLERAAEQRPDGAIMRDLEEARQWQLLLLAEHGTDDLDEVVSLIETLRGDRPEMRDAAEYPDPVVARLCRPFTLLGTRLAALPDTVLLVLEPSIGDTWEDASGPILLTISSGDQWHLAKGAVTTFEALRRLNHAAAREQERLNTRELPLRGPPSAALRQAAAEAWLSLPAPTREALLAARTVLCMPNSAAGLDRLPVELLLHDGGWLGVTHAVSRCPSFKHLEDLVAPNARHRVPATRATIAQTAPIKDLSILTEAEADARTAMRAASLLGLDPELRPVSTADDVRTLFVGAALVHYVGHGFASELGEWLPTSADNAVTPAEIPWTEAEDAPVVFFNACLLGRVRHISGGRQKGWVVSLLTNGSPAVIGASVSVPDTACPLVTREIYRAAWKAPIGEAIRLARERLNADGYHPLISGAYVVHGDPNALLSRVTDALPRATAQITMRWPALLTRFLATAAAPYRDQLLAALEHAPVGVRAQVRPWVLGHGETSQWPGLVKDLLSTDAEGAGALRIIMGVEKLKQIPHTAEQDVVRELQATYLTAAALEDSYAMVYLLIRYRTLLQAIFPDDHEALATTAEARLQLLDADHALLRPLIDTSS